jgi:hypothetical protein
VSDDRQPAPLRLIKHLREAHGMHDVDELALLLVEHCSEAGSGIGVLQPGPRQVDSPRSDRPDPGSPDGIRLLVTIGVLRGRDDDTLMAHAAQLFCEVECQSLDAGVVRRKELVGNESDSHAQTPSKSSSASAGSFR